MRYIKKPTVFKAVQFVKENIEEVLSFLPSENITVVYLPEKDVFKCFIDTADGAVMKCSEGDYIIKGVAGEYFLCDPNVFHTTYERYRGAQEGT